MSGHSLTVQTIYCTSITNDGAMCGADQNILDYALPFAKIGKQVSNQYSRIPAPPAILEFCLCRSVFLLSSPFFELNSKRLADHAKLQNTQHKSRTSLLQVIDLLLLSWAKWLND